MGRSHLHIVDTFELKVYSHITYVASRAEVVLIVQQRTAAVKLPAPPQPTTRSVGDQGFHHRSEGELFQDPTVFWTVHKKKYPRLISHQGPTHQTPKTFEQPSSLSPRLYASTPYQICRARDLATELPQRSFKSWGAARRSRSCLDSARP